MSVVKNDGSVEAALEGVEIQAALSLSVVKNDGSVEARAATCQRRSLVRLVRREERRLR